MSCHDIQVGGSPGSACNLKLAEDRRLGAVGGTGRRIGALLDLLLTWQERAAQRSHLSRLDDRMLRDVGLTRDQIAREASKPFWQG